MSVVGRGKQRGIKIGEITYDEIPKELLLTVVKDADKDYIIKTVLKAARTDDKDAFGDGKILYFWWKKSTPSAPASKRAAQANWKRSRYERDHGHCANQYDEQVQEGLGGGISCRSPPGAHRAEARVWWI